MPTTDYSNDVAKGSPNAAEQDSAAKNSKFSVLYEQGLEVVDRDTAPEVVPGSNLDRKSSLFRPEAYHAAPHYSDKPSHQSYYEPPQAIRPEYEELHTYGHKNSNDSKGAIVGATEIEQHRKEPRRCCGLRRKTFIIVMVAVAIVVLFGVILGAVLGTVLPKKWAKDDSHLQTWSSTGLASVLDGDGSGRLLTYYQDPDGRIIENSFFDGRWTLENKRNVDLSVVTTQAAYGSPLAAISYSLGAKTHRQVFFMTSTGAVMTANSSETSGGIATDWSIARSITSDRIDPKGIGLAACWSDKNMNGIRLFYPSQYGYIQEMKWTFGNDTWKDGDEIVSSDSLSGMGCATKNSASDQYLNLYYRSTSSGRVKQAFSNYDDKDVYWSYHDGPASWTNHSIAIGSDIAVCSDDSQSEYIYYQMQGGLVTRGLVNPSSTHYEGFDNQAGATVGSKLACSYFDGGSMLFFQNRTSASTIYASDVTRSGVTISNFAVP